MGNANDRVASAARNNADAHCSTESPEVLAARDSLKLRRLELERRRLDIEDQLARVEARNKIAMSELTRAKSVLPTTLDTPIEQDTLSRQGDVGLADVYVGKSAIAPADDIADLLVMATNDIDNVEFLVVSDTSIVADVEVAQLLRRR